MPLSRCKCSWRHNASRFAFVDDLVQQRNAGVRAATERGGDEAAYGMRFRLASPQLPSVLRKRNVAYGRFVDVEDTRPRNHVLGHGAHQAGLQQLGDNFLLFV